MDYSRRYFDTAAICVVPQLLIWDSVTEPYTQTSQLYGELPVLHSDLQIILLNTRIQSDILYIILRIKVTNSTDTTSDIQLS